MAFRVQTHNSSAESSQEHDSSMEMLTSPAPAASFLRRRLEFNSPILEEKQNKINDNNNEQHKHNNNNNNNRCNNNNNNVDQCKINPASSVSVSPPYRKVRALRLFDTPATPKTILQKSSANHLSAVAAVVTKQQQVAAHNLLKLAGRETQPLQNPAVTHFKQQHAANVNPFTPDSLMAHNKKRCRIQLGLDGAAHNQSFAFGSNTSPELKDDDLDFHSAPKRLALQDTNISRYQKEFLEISLIGIGEFGLVYKCLNRLDGCIYAIKKSIKPVAGSSFEKRALNEVWAHAVLGKHDNVVRYYSAWAEDNHMLIQNEYCNGGSLQSLIQKRSLVESELKLLLLHVAEGLRYIHANDLVHMDLKAGNIFLTQEMPNKYIALTAEAASDEDDGMDSIYTELSNAECMITYKIGDLGHVTSVQDPNVEEGDCRYLPNEILQEDYSQLFKGDIFSLGITLYEAAGGGPLPKNGPEWHDLRNGKVPYIPKLSKEFNDIIKQMTHPDPEKRPSSKSIFTHPVLSSMESKTKSQLTQELAIEKQKNEILLKKLCEAKKLIKSYENKEKERKLLSPHLLSEQRLLRSYTRDKKRLTACRLGTKLEEMGLRDRNKNVVNY